MSARIPTLDITRFDTDRDAFVAELGAAYREWGFAGIRNHEIAQADDGAERQCGDEDVEQHGRKGGQTGRGVKVWRRACWGDRLRPCVWQR